MAENLIISIIFGYLIGSIPFAYIISKLYQKDIRKLGTKNVGASNVYIKIGKFPGILTGLLDVAKGFFVVFVLMKFTNNNIAMIGGIAATIGHIYPIFLKFKGGKGAATSVGVLLPIMWKESLIALFVWGLIYLLFKKIRITGLIAFSLIPFFGLIFKRQEETIYNVMVIVMIRWLINLQKRIELRDELAK